ncbi:MAG: hypothetical protein HRF49_03370 [bacterium]|jgi:hypothetical protein
MIRHLFYSASLLLILLFVGCDNNVKELPNALSVHSEQDKRDSAGSFDALYSHLIRELSSSSEYEVDYTLSVDPQYDPELLTLTFAYPNTGDYNLDGEVSVADLTPLALNLGHVVGDDFEDENDSWLDGDGDGEVGISDVTVIARNFLRKVEGFGISHLNDTADPSITVPLFAVPLSDCISSKDRQVVIELHRKYAVPSFIVETLSTGPGQTLQISPIGGFEEELLATMLRPVKEYTFPDGVTEPVVANEVFVDFRPPNHMQTNAAQQFLMRENLAVQSYWFGERATLITVRLPSYISLEYVCRYWVEEYPELLFDVHPITFVELSYD